MTAEDELEVMAMAIARALRGATALPSLTEWKAADEILSRITTSPELEVAVLRRVSWERAHRRLSAVEGPKDRGAILDAVLLRDAL